MDKGKRWAHFELNRRGLFGVIGGAIAISSAAGVGGASANPASEDNKPDTPSGLFDPLTGLPGEVLFYERADALARLDETALSVAIIDISNFDAMQRCIGRPLMNAGIWTLSKRQRRYADMGWVHTLARLRDRQFGLLLTGCNEASVRCDLEAIMRSVRAPMHLGARGRRFSASLGVIRKQRARQPASELIAAARAAASEARLAGNNRSRFIA